MRFTLKELIEFKCFNSMIVRLKARPERHYLHQFDGFNSMIVRLKGRTRAV